MDQLREAGRTVFSYWPAWGLPLPRVMVPSFTDTDTQQAAASFYPIPSVTIDINYFWMPWEHRVCSECLETNPYAIWLVKVGCFHPHWHRIVQTVTVVIEHECMKMITVGPLPPTFIVHRGDYEICSNLPCSDESCVLAHSTYEFDTWNTKKWLIDTNLKEVSPIINGGLLTQSPSEVCQMCLQQNPNAIWLSWLKCVNPMEHSAFPTVTVVANNINKQLVRVRPLPANITDIGLIGRCPRRYCQVKERCTYAHSAEEANYWKWQSAIRVYEKSDSQFNALYSDYKYPDEINEFFVKSLTSPLTKENYKSKYHKLIYLEEIESSRKIIQECDSDAVEIVVDYPSHHMAEGLPTVYLYGLSSMAIHYASYNNCRATFVLELPESHPTYSASVGGKPDYERGALILELPSSSSFFSHFSPERTRSFAHVHFEVSHSSNHTLHRIIDSVPFVVLQKLLPTTPLSPCQYPIPVKSNFIGNVRLDENYQKIALRKILKCSPDAPFLLLGPFGTGKTYLLAAAVVKVLEEDAGCKVLVCTHQNRCADGLCRFIQGNMGVEDASKYLVRVVPTQEKFDSSKRNIVNIPVLASHDPALYTDWPVMVTTFMTAFHLFVYRHYFNFTHIFIDEGAQCPEPEVLGAIVLAKSSTKVVIVGDNKQVGPKVRVVSDKARDNGLGCSLLERLFVHYSGNKQMTMSHTATLLTNYRCHPSILTMASSLFYECTLVSRSSSETHPMAPYPLVLVCTNFDQRGFENLSAENEEEAVLLIKKMMKFIQTRPSHFPIGSPIGLLASTNQQVACLRKLWWKMRWQLSPHDRSIRVEVMPTYNIQGEEFSAVFLSTSEPTDHHGMPCDSIKSICNEYVFNTVVTRARSLVCVAGNPFLLMHMGSGFKTNCWIEYVRKCLQCDSLHVDSQLAQSQEQSLTTILELLFKKVGIMESLTEVAEEDCQEFDAIIERYIDELQKRKDYKVAKNLIQGPTGEFKWVEEKGADSKDGQPTCTDSKNIVWCKLNCSNFCQVTATPLNRPGEPLQLKGLPNRRCGFHGDVVRINLSKKCVLLDEQTENAIHTTHFGEAFVCRVSPKNPILFYPIDNRYPNFVNLPMLSRDQKASGEVICFDPKSINNVPKVNDFIPMKCAVKMVFVVKFLGWKKDSLYPLGIIVGALPSAQSPFVADLILRISNRVPPAKFPPFSVETTEGSNTKPTSKRTPGNTKHTSKRTPGNTKHTSKRTPVFEDAFTIDPMGATDHDDALTCRLIMDDKINKCQVFEIGIHITDVQKFIPQNGELDKLACQRGCSFYRSSDSCVSHMLPEDLVDSVLSFSLGSQRSAQSVITSFTIQDGRMTSVSKPKFVESLVTSSLELTYMEAENYLCHELILFPTDHSLHVRENMFNAKFPEHPPLCEKLRVLWKAAMFLRKDRLGEHGAYSFQVKDGQEICPEAHYLVEEMMIWANSNVAERIYRSLPMCSIIRAQEGPSEEQLEELRQKHSATMSTSLSLKSYTATKEEGSQNVLVLKSMKDLIERYLNLGFVRYALHQVQYEHQHPMTSIISTKLQRARSPSVYKRSDQTKSSYLHDTLRCEQYTHFTSPIRRYVDIVTQRLLHAVLNFQSCPYKTIQEVDNICLSMTKSLRCSNAYDRDVRKSDLAVSLTESSREFEATVIENKERATLELHFFDPKLSALSPEEKRISIKSLKSISIPSNWGGCASLPPHQSSNPLTPRQSSNPMDFFKWQVKVASFTGRPNCFLSHPNLKLDSTHPKVASPLDRCATIDIFFPEDMVAIRHSPLKEEKLHVNIDPLTSEIPISEWNSLLDLVKLDPTEIDIDHKSKCFKQLSSLTSPSQPSPQRLYHNKCSLWVYTVNRALREGDVFHVQVSASSHKDHHGQLSSPCLQLVEVAPELKICVQHSSYPSKCFTDRLTESATRQRYGSIREYFQCWEQVLLAEAAITSVSDSEILLIKDVILQWPKLEPRLGSGGRVSYRLPVPDCGTNVGVRMDLPKDFVSMSWDFFQFNAGDFACIRYDVHDESGTEVCRSVFHMVVDHVEKKSIAARGMNVLDSVSIFMKFVCEATNSVCPTMAKLLTESSSHQQVGGRLVIKCELQLIPLTLPFRRVYRSLHDLMFEMTSDVTLEHSLAEKIALGIARTENGQNPQNIGTFLTSDQVSVATSLWPFQRRSHQRGSSGRKKLNKFQKFAIDLACSNRFTLIQGPPGTGKSVTGAHLAYALAMKLKKERVCVSVPSGVTTIGGEKVEIEERRMCVMYCAPSNQAANVILDMLTCEKSPVKDELTIIRVFSKMIEQKRYPGPTFHQQLFQKGSSTETKCEQRHTPYALHEKIREIEPKIVTFDRQFHSLEKQGKVPSQYQRESYRALVYRTERRILHKEADIILCTCNEASSHRIMNSINPVYCIIDECAMATEPECMVPIRSAEHVVLIGDHQQLSPVIKNKEAEEMGLGTSLFLRYVNEKKGEKTRPPLQKPHMLQIQYRMHAELCRFPSKEFYNGKLQTDESINRRHNMETKLSFWPKGPNKPFVFCDIVGREGGLPSQSNKKAKVALESKFNVDEANKIAEIVKFLMGHPHKIKAETLAVLTPYSAQKEEIIKSLKDRGITDVTVKSITESQGSEYGIVLLSTVRSKRIEDITDSRGQRKPSDIRWKRANLGFVTDRNRICVGITRCKFGLVIVGNRTLLSYDETWRSLIEHYQRSGCIVKAASFPPRGGRS